MPTAVMTEPSTTRHHALSQRSIRISRPANEPSWRKRVNGSDANLHGHSIGTRSLVVEMNGDTLLCDHWALPFADSSIDAIDVVNVVEHIRDDLSFYAELNRVLRIGGILTLRLPNAGPLAGFDSLNLYKYFTDVTKKGLRVPETEEIGFRRHLPLDELTEALGPGFEIVRSTTSGVAISETVRFGLLVGLTTFAGTPSRYYRFMPLVNAASKLDGAIKPGNFGFWLHVVAIRTEENSGDCDASDPMEPDASPLPNEVNRGLS
jgi:SAM-dependent methyltransferase